MQKKKSIGGLQAKETILYLKKKKDRKSEFWSKIPKRFLSAEEKFREGKKRQRHILLGGIRKGKKRLGDGKKKAPSQQRKGSLSNVPFRKKKRDPGGKRSRV